MRTITTVTLAVLLFAGCSGEHPRFANNAENVNTPSPTPMAEVADSGPALDVPYVQTPDVIVDEMLRMAKVSGDDILYDLGSGDGRIPITAAKRFGTRGVGIDLDPERIKEAKENAEKQGVSDKVTFIEGDIFETDFSKATVVTMYLLPTVNMKLRPKLLDMKPGTRIVSHNYDMGDWMPEETKHIVVDGTDHFVFSWIVPEKGTK